MAQLSDLLSRVHDEFPAVPELLALRALSDSVAEFCRRTHYWQADLPAVRTRAGRTEFTLYPDTGQLVLAVKEVRLPDGTRVDPFAGELKRLLVTPISSGSVPLGFVQRNPSTIELLNATDDVVSLSVKAALTIIPGTTTVDILDDLVNEYSEALGAGAKMRLVRQASQPWYAPDAAPGYAGPFYMAVNEAKARALTTLGEANLQVQMRSW
jgi:hypothetical protein